MHGNFCHGLGGYRYDIPLPVEADNKTNRFESGINPANLSESKRIGSFISNNYTPIDWQLDFKSGYRWSESTWYKNIKFSHLIIPT